MDDIIYSHELSKKERQALQRFLYQEMIRLSILIDNALTEPQIDGLVSAFNYFGNGPKSVIEPQIHSLMSALVKKAKYQVNGETTEQRINQLLHFLYQEQGFSCHHEEYFYSENMLLHKLLQKKRGMPVSLGAILLYLASVLDLPLFPVNFPTQFIVRADIITESGRKETRFINPWDGSYLSFSQMEKWLEGEMGYEAELNRDFLRIAEEDELLERLETVCKMALTREGKYMEALRLIEYRMRFKPEDPYEIRDRGMVLASMECFQAAYDDLSYFIDQCPDDPSAMMLKLEMSSLEKQSKASVFH